MLPKPLFFVLKSVCVRWKTLDRQSDQIAFKTAIKLWEIGWTSEVRFHCEFFIAHDSTVILCMFPLLSFELSNCLFAIGLCFVTQCRLFSDVAFPVVVAVVSVAAVSLLLVYIFAFRLTVNDCCNSIPIVRIPIRSRFVSFHFHSAVTFLHSLNRRFSTDSLFVFTIFQSKEVHANIKWSYRVIQSSNQIRSYLHSERRLSLNELVLSVLLLLLLLMSVSAAAQVFNKDSI